MSKINLQPEYGSPEGKFPKEEFKPCERCNGEGHHDSHECYSCEGSGSIEMTEEEVENDNETRKEEAREY